MEHLPQKETQGAKGSKGSIEQFLQSEIHITVHMISLHHMQKSKMASPWFLF